MTIEKLRNILMHKKAATEEYPFGPDTIVVKVKNKMFIYLSPSTTKNIASNPDMIPLKVSNTAILPS